MVKTMECGGNEREGEDGDVVQRKGGELLMAMAG